MILNLILAALPVLPAVRSEKITDAALPAEGYRIRISAAGEAKIEAADDAGRFYAEQTLAQLPKPLKAGEIEDWPAFGWRGVLIDESRHFFGKEAIKRTIDEMARFKFNVLHWHLMDDQGCRFPLKGYPRMTTVGATRPSPDYSRWIHDPGESFGAYGPFGYTEEEIREVVAYAKARHIRIVPEVEIPGHAREVIAAYPELFCGSADDFIRACAFCNAQDGKCLAETAVCLGNDRTIRFFEEVLDEVCELFPDEVVHIGGDECPRTNWKRCPKCQARMKALGLKTEDDLQNWCTQHFVAYLAKKGRKAVGWEEILKGGMVDGAIVMSWLGAKSGRAAAAGGHAAVMCPHLSCYLDYEQGLPGDGHHYPTWGKTVLPLSKVYEYDPCEGIPAEQRRFILGGQVCNWTEFTPGEPDLQWKLWPRGLAMAEVLWSGPGARTFDDFLVRLAPVREAMVKRGVNAAPIDGRRPKKVLMVGNSFSKSVLAELPKVALHAGERLVLVNLMIGGCPLKRHWENIERSAADPEFRPYAVEVNWEGETKVADTPLAKVAPQAHGSLQDIVKAGDWDLITVQQASPDSWKPETYQPYADNVIAKLRELAPNAEIRVHQTWAYNEQGTSDQMGMFDGLKAAYGDLAAKHGFRVIPVGEAIQAYRTDLPVTFRRLGKDEIAAVKTDVIPDMHGDPVGFFYWNTGRPWEKRDPKGDYRLRWDGCHLNPEGKYLQALVWYASVFGGDPRTVPYAPEKLDAHRAKVMRECAAKVTGM